MKRITDKLTTLMKEIEAAKEKASTLKGRKEEALKRLKEDFGFSSKEQADKWLDKTKISLEDMEEKIREDFERLKEEVSW